MGKKMPSEAADPRSPQLRSAAEAQLRRTAPPATPTPDAAALLRDLQVHQIELEMQNEELRRVQVALEESRDRYVDLYEFAPVGYLTITASRQIAEVNLAGATLLGGERATVLQQTFDHFVAEEDRDRWYRLFAGVMGSAGGRGGIELKLPRGGGAAIYVHLDCLRVDSASAPHGMRLAMTDISAMALNKQLTAAQDDLLEQLLFQTSLLESVPVSIFWKDAEGRYQGCNRTYEEMLGKSRSDIIGKSVFDMAPPEIAEKYHAMDAELFQHPGRQMYEWLIQQPSGEIRNVLFHKATFLRGNGTVGGLIGALVDITELKQKEVALAESEERLRTATETARDAIIVLEAEHGSITAWNPAAETMFGYARAETLGQVLHDFLPPPRFREAARHGVAHFAASGEGGAVGKTLELVALHKDGTEFPIELSLSAMQIHGKWHATGIARDITERKRAEESLRRANRELRAISHCNLALMKAGDEPALLNDICRIVCDEAGYRLVWVGYAEHDEAKTVRPIAWAGFDSGYIADTRLTWADDAERGQGPAGRAIRSGETVVVQDFASDSLMTPWRQAALQRGYRSGIALPLKDERAQVFGVLLIYSAEINAIAPVEVRLLEEMSGDLAFGIVTLRNCAARAAAEAALRLVSRHNEMILQSAGEGIWGVDVDGRITFINPAALVALGYEKEELLGRHSHEALHHSRPDGSPYPLEDCQMHATLHSGLSVRGREETLWRKDGSALPVLYSSTAIREDENIIGAVVTFRDISELKHYQAQLERKSSYDDLTDLPNRNLLMDRLTQAVARCQREQGKLAVLVLNLDRFGEINDSLGRSVGDSVLRETAARLGQLVRESDTLARAGGDEFVLAGQIKDEEEAAHLARRILESLSHPFSIEGKELFLYSGIGVSILPRDGESSEALLNNAQVAMYRTKASGGNNFLFYSAEMNAHTLEHLNLEIELRRAIEHNEFLLYYQPQVSLRSGRIVGMEALLRWKHPERGLVSPMEFIPTAETTGLIVPIGEWVLRTACTQNRAWLAAGLHTVAVAVNLSVRQFEAHDIVALTSKILSETGLDPSYLELELTESAAMGDAEAFVEMTEKLKGLSVNLAIDDFGTGYSSLSYLKRFALDRLKIDQSFVRDIVTDPDSAAIAMAIITLGHSLGLSVIAEGVETEAQLNFLRVRGCDEMQGYYFSRPLPGVEFEQLLRDERELSLPATTDQSEDTLLLVDDEPAILSALQRQLRRDGYRILAATSGQEALQLLATHAIGVVLSDQRMPQMSGTEFLAKVRVMYPDTVRMILSGYSELRSITEVVNRGDIYKFLEKPWDEVVLRDTVREAFRHYEARRVVRDVIGGEVAPAGNMPP